MRRSLPVVPLLIILALVSGARAEVSRKTAIGVLELTSENIPAAEMRLLTDRLRHELFVTGRFTVLEREQMGMILEEQGFQQSGCVASECIVEVGQLIGVEMMVGGSVGTVGDVYTMTIRLINVGTGEVLRTAVRDCRCTLSDVLMTVIAQVAADLAQVQAPEHGAAAMTMGRGPTNVSGDIYTTAWRKEGSPYRVVGSATVAKGSLLTIEPGVDVLFDSDVPFEVKGRLTAEGTDKDSIRFLPGSSVRWGGIRISGGDSSTLGRV